MFINATTNQIITKTVAISLLRRGWTLWNAKTGEGWEWYGDAVQWSARRFRRALAHTMRFTAQWNDTLQEKMIFRVSPN